MEIYAETNNSGMPSLILSLKKYSMQEMGTAGTMEEAPTSGAESVEQAV
jgi:hypothetical protein